MMFTLRQTICLLALSGITAHAQFLPTGIPTIDLSMSGVAGSSPMTLAWNPNFSQYYGGRGGSSSYGGIVWDATGAVVQNRSPINIDIRSINYNALTSNLEIVTYSANSGNSGNGYVAVNLDAAGLFTATYTSTGVMLSGLPSSQTAPAFDAARNALYAYDSGSSVRVLDAATGAVSSTITLDLTTAGTSTLITSVIGYDSLNDALIGFTTNGGNRVVAFSATTGDFLASISLPGLGSPASSWGMAYTNDQFFIFDGNLNAYRGFVIVPEPGTATLLLLGLLVVLVAARRAIFARQA